MHALLAPILAQVVTLAAGARTEVRDVIELGDQRLEGSASAGIGLSFTSPHLSLAVGYAPGVTVTPLESSPREVLLNDSLFAGAVASYGFRFGRNSVTLSQSGTYLLQNPVLQALSAAPPAQPALTTPVTPAPVGANPPAAPSTGTNTGGSATPAPAGGGGATARPDQVAQSASAANGRRALDERVQTWALRSSAVFVRALSRVATFAASGGYSFGAGLGSSREFNPLVQGPDAALGVTARVSRSDTLTTSLTGQYQWSDLDAHGQMVVLAETWHHDFSRRTYGELGTGVSYTRSWTGDSATLNGIYPTGLLGFGYTDRLAQGIFRLSANATTSPVLDATTSLVDPRVGVGTTAGWTRRKLSLNAYVSSAISLASDPEGPGTFNSLSAGASAGYDLGAGFSVDGGVRSAWQRFESFTVVNPSSAIFIGLNWGAAVPLIAPRQR